MENGEDLKVVQKKNGVTHVFTFQEDVVNFAYKDKSGSGDREINYGDFPNKSSIQIEQNEWVRNVGFLWILLGLFQLGSAYVAGAPLSGKGLWVALGLGCLAWAYMSIIKYTVLQTSNGGVFVIQDKYHDQIMSTIKERRKKQLLNWYGNINSEGDLEEEINRFKWLHNQGVLTKEESENKIAQAELLFKDEFNVEISRLN